MRERTIRPSAPAMPDASSHPRPAPCKPIMPLYLYASAPSSFVCRNPSLLS